MTKSIFAKAGAGIAALLLVGTAVTPDTAHAQASSNCEGSELITPPPYFVDPDGPGPLPPVLVQDPPYYDTYSGLGECGANAGDLASVANTMAGVGEGFVQQQLNFNMGFGSFASPTGRFRKTHHNGLTERGAGGFKTENFEVSEGSVFGNATYDLPGTVMGGKMRFSALAGYDRMTQKSHSRSYTTEIDSFVYGGSYLWSQGSFYSMTLIIGLSGEADTANAGGAYSYDLTGYYSSNVVGNTFDLGAAKFDVRLGLGRHDIDGGRFFIPGTVTALSGNTEAWNGSITGTLFTITDLGGGAVARPYLLASYKHVFDEKIEIRSNAGQRINYSQGEDFGRVEGGFDVVQGIYTYGAGFYTEFSEDQSTVGGRLGLSIKLQ